MENSVNDMRAGFLVLASSIECLADKNLYDKAYGLVTEARRKKVDSYKVEEDRKRSLAAGVLLNHAMRLWRGSELSGESSHRQQKFESKLSNCFINAVLQAALVICRGVKNENGSGSISGSRASGIKVVDSEIDENVGSAGGLKYVDLQTAIEEYDSAYDYAVAARANGKPVFLEYPEVHFNLSHSGNYVVCAVAQREVGVDVEGGRRVRPSIENRFFSEEECCWVCEADSEELHSERFFRLWTLKEAYSKLTGEGISYGIGKAHFEMPLGDNPRGKGLEWQADFYEYIVGDKYVAVAVEKF